MIQNPASDVSEVVEYLITCEKTLAGLYTLADCLITWQVTAANGPESMRKQVPPDSLRAIDERFAHDTDV